MNITLRVDKPLCLPKFKSITYISHMTFHLKSTEIEVNKCIIFPIKSLKMQNTIILLILVAKTCEKVIRCLRLKVEFVFINKRESSKIFNIK